MMLPLQKRSRSWDSKSWDVYHLFFFHKGPVHFSPCLKDPCRKGNALSPRAHNISEGTCPLLHGTAFPSSTSWNGGSSCCSGGCIHHSSPKWQASSIHIPSPWPACHSSWCRLSRRMFRCWNGGLCSPRHPAKAIPSKINLDQSISIEDKAQYIILALYLLLP